MVTFSFTVEDLARTRFALSPMWELVTSLRMLRDPQWAAMHVPWMRGALPIARGLDLTAAFALTPPVGYIPDFLTPPPSDPLARFEDELERVRATPAAQLRADVETLFRGRTPPGPVASLVARPRRELTRLADSLAAYWERALEPHWPRIRALLDADLAHRARHLTAGGPALLFADLHRSVRWSRRSLEVQQSYQATVRLDGRGLLLVPSAFQWQSPASISTSPWQPTLLYPARGVGVLWEPERAPSAAALGRVVGRTRAQLLAVLDTPRSTTELAGRLGLTPAGVSQHLTALRGAALVTPTRQGRTVLYVRTALADQLVTAGGSSRAHG